jgi:hypothetical protein
MAKVVYVVEEERSSFSFFVSMLLNKWVLLALLIWYVYRTITVKIRSANLTRAQANSMKWGLIGLVLFALAERAEDFWEGLNPRIIRVWHILLQIGLVRRDSLSLKGEEHGLGYSFLASFCCCFAGRLVAGLEAWRIPDLVVDGTIFEFLGCWLIVSLLTKTKMWFIFGFPGLLLRKILYVGWGLNKIRQIERVWKPFAFTLLAFPATYLPWTTKIFYFTIRNIAGRTSRKLTDKIIAPKNKTKKEEKLDAKEEAERIAEEETSSQFSPPPSGKKKKKTVVNKKELLHELDDFFFVAPRTWQKQLAWNAVMLTIMSITQGDTMESIIEHTYCDDEDDFWCIPPAWNLHVHFPRFCFIIIALYIMHYYQQMAPPVAKFAKSDPQVVAQRKADKKERKKRDKEKVKQRKAAEKAAKKTKQA